MTRQLLLSDLQVEFPLAHAVSAAWLPCVAHSRQVVQARRHNHPRHDSPHLASRSSQLTCVVALEDCDYLCIAHQTLLETRHLVDHEPVEETVLVRLLTCLRIASSHHSWPLQWEKELQQQYLEWVALVYDCDKIDHIPRTDRAVETKLCCAHIDVGEVLEVEASLDPILDEVMVILNDAGNE